MKIKTQSIMKIVVGWKTPNLKPEHAGNREEKTLKMYNKAINKLRPLWPCPPRRNA